MDDRKTDPTEKIKNFEIQLNNCTMDSVMKTLIYDSFQRCKENLPEVKENILDFIEQLVFALTLQQSTHKMFINELTRLLIKQYKNSNDWVNLLHIKDDIYQSILQTVEHENMGVKNILEPSVSSEIEFGKLSLEEKYKALEFIKKGKP
jgi:hypothetical protein